MNGLNPLNAYKQPMFQFGSQSLKGGINPPDTGNAKQIEIPSQRFIQGQDARLEQLSKVYDDKALKRMGAVECATCASRTYVDGSNDPSVSFKTPTHVSPEQSVAAVTSHEMEHVANEQANAEKAGGEVISQSVSIHMSTCPECGKAYAAGGLTRTTVRTPIEQPVSNPTGNLVDMKL